MKKKYLTTLSVIAASMALIPGSLFASTAYGTLNNFDTVNDTGQVCHGFEIEIEDMHSVDITYTYDYNHYGQPHISEDLSDPNHPKTIIRYESSKDSNGNYTSYTAIPAGPIPPTQGHQCTNPNVNEGCEHFGVGYYRTAGIVRYNWLVDDGAGNLVKGPAVNVATPTWVYNPPVGVQPANVQAKIVAPPEPPEVAVKEFGEAVWAKSIVTQTHNNNPVELKDLVSDDPDDPTDKNWTNGEPDEIEIEFQIMQKEFSKPNEGNDVLEGGKENLENGDEVVTRRYEFFKYSGPHDPESYEALCDKYPDPTPTEECDPLILGHDIVGDYIGAQMAGFNVEALLGMIDNLQDNNMDEAYPQRTVVIGGNTPYTTNIVLGTLPEGMSIDSATGVLSGTPLESGNFVFTIEATDSDDLAKGYEQITVSKQYSLNIIGQPVIEEPTPGDLNDDGSIDINDLNLLKSLFGQAAAPNDPADVNADGVINVLDYRKTIQLCTKPRCLP
jgi:hypothetical protein